MRTRTRGWSHAALLVVALMLAAPIAHPAEYGDIVFKRKVAGMDDIPPGVFPHWLHRMQYKCGACHDELFPMKTGSSEVTMEAIGAGKSCGVCHNGKKAFESNVDTCRRCHYK